MKAILSPSAILGQAQDRVQDMHDDAGLGVLFHQNLDR
jgi:hypothetical protein